MDGQGQDSVKPSSPIDNVISQLDDEVKATKKLINCLLERLGSVLASPAPTPESKGQPETARFDCPLGGRIDGIHHIAEESNRLLADIIERLLI